MVADPGGAIWIPADALDTVFERAQDIQRREAILFAEMNRGAPLGELLQLEALLRQREANPALTFNEHLKEIGRAI